MPVNNRYAALAARVYDLDKPVGRSFGDVEFYLERLKGLNGPVLEPAVGNGRLFVPLLEAGVAMEGFDASGEMLGYCRRACESRSLHAGLSRQTFQDFSYPERFDAIVVPLGSFQLITRHEEALAVLRRFHEHLAPGGRLILDLDAIDGFLGAPHSVRTWQAGGDELLTLTADRTGTDFVAQTTTTCLRYEHWRAGRLVDTEIDLFCLRWWGVAEFEMALRAVGFTEVVACGDYRHGRAPRMGDGIVTFEAWRDASGA
ncbi:class I SAM-dependent methyltransferase [Flavobacterium sp. MXW15]|uniref:Class I SAM-dependent methyltransferase n=1 Tax=Xanthomonas chitinilytica TaxID=2989819 RepID=A0ABT3JX14_9XANT|nr:class I SAM-dependent methyltransferase [Xanthomonas sp. H13-6]MCW4455792.1 class I SAM-dependent methyltransferase [Flavobacterium sp. MXW15]MCW4473008.1 class I SAM-dependent methyltransferase [Xanthomonas sp. H13-6]